MFQTEHRGEGRKAGLCVSIREPRCSVQVCYFMEGPKWQLLVQLATGNHSSSFHREETSQTYGSVAC